MKKLWFRRKWFGWGWYPATWQGWLVTLVYAGAIILLGSSVDDTAPFREVAFMFLLPTVLLTIVFIRIAYKTGEKPKWQWGRREK